MSIKERVMCLMCICTFFATVQVLRAEVKNRYIYFSIGTANVSYPNGKDIDRITEALNDTRAPLPSPLTLNLLGFYYSLSNGKTMLGGVVNGVGEQYKEFESKLLTIQFSPSISAMHFFGREIGLGPFLRADLGPAWLIWDTSGTGVRSGETTVGVSGTAGVGKEDGKVTAGTTVGTVAKSDEDIGFLFGQGTQSQVGVSLLLGIGYAFPIKGTNVLLSVGYANRFFDGERYGTLNVSVGGFVY